MGREAPVDGVALPPNRAPSLRTIAATSTRGTGAMKIPAPGLP